MTKQEGPKADKGWARGIAAVALIVFLPIVLIFFEFWRPMWGLASWASLIIPAWYFCSFWVIVRFLARQSKDEAD